MKKSLCILLSILSLTCAFAKEKLRYNINIWDKVPQMPETYVRMDVFISENPNGTAVIVCPGGSYHHLGIYNEGYTTAKWFNTKGVSAFVLRYSCIIGVYSANFTSYLFYNFKFDIIASATFIPSIAADVIPPAYPAPSPQGYRPLIFA